MVAPAAGGSPDEVPIDVDLIKVLASDTRRDILRLLGERRRTLTELAAALDLKKATVLEHLQKLVAAQLIRRMDDGERLWVYYELTHRGLRIVRPGRTRFYLIMAGSAAAILLIGAIVAAAMLNGVGPRSTSSEDATTGSQAMLADDLRISAPLVIWRGFDEGVPVQIDGPAPEGSQLLIDQFALDVVDGRATLSANEVDGLAPGRHALALRTLSGETLALPNAIDVRDTPVALAPMSIPAGQTTQLILSVGAPGLPVPTNVAVRVQGTPVPLGELGRERTLSLTPSGTGDIRIEVGRLTSLDVRVLSDIRLEALADNGTLVLNVSDANGALSNATATLDDALLGHAEANGTLRVPWPSPGERALRIVAPDGRAREFAVVIKEGALAPAPTRLSLSAYAQPGVSTLSARIDVANAGVVNETVTLIARMDGVAIASALVDVPAHGSAASQLVANVPITSGVQIDAYGMRLTNVSLRAFDAYDADGDGVASGDTSAGATPPAAAPSPAPTSPTPATAFSDTSSSGRGVLLSEKSYAYFSGAPPDASTTLYPPTMPTSVSPSAEYAPAPAVPFVSPILVIALVALAALALRRRGSSGR